MVKQLEYENEIERSYRWNFSVNTLDAVFHGLSISFVSSSTILPLYISYLSNNPLLIGLVSAIAGSAYLLPQLFAANYVEELDRKKPLVVKTGFFLERLPFLFIAISTLLLSTNSPNLALSLFFFFFLWHGLGEGIVVIAWQDMLAKLFRYDRRGRFFGITGFGETFMSIIGAIIATYILGKIEFPNNFALLFSLTFIGLCIAWIFLSLTREPPNPVVKQKTTNQEYFRKLPSIIQEDQNFKNFLISRTFMGFGRMGIGFIVVYAINRWSISDSFIGQLTITIFLAQMFASIGLGLIADKKGHKINIIIDLISLFVAMILTIMASTPTVLYVVFILIGVDRAIETVSAQVIVFEFSNEQVRPTYIGLASTIIGVFGGLSPIIGGLIASQFNYQSMFFVSTILLSVSFVVMYKSVKDPRVKSNLFL